MRRPRRRLGLPTPRTWFLALVFAVASFAVLHAPDSTGGPAFRTPANWPTSSRAYAAATDYFLKVDGITGGSTVAGYAGQSMLDSWQFGTARAIAAIVANDREASAPQCGDFAFTKALDSASPGLFRQSLDGESIPTVVLSGTTTATASPVLFLRLTFTAVLADSYSLASGGDAPLESVSFTYGTITVSYRRQNPDGTFAAPISSGYDCAAARSIGGGAAPTTTSVGASGSPTYGSPVTLTANVTSASGTPTGTVAFSAGSVLLCPAAAVSGGLATCQTSSLVVGPNQVTASFTPDTSAFGSSTASATITVAPAPLTITTLPSTRVYGDANPSFTAAYSGFVNGDGPSSLSGTLAFSTAATAASPVGAYDVTPSGLSSPNYAITFAAGTLTVTPAPLTVTANDSTKVYGQPNPAFSATFSGFVNGDGVSALAGNLAFDTAATTGSGVGAYTVTPGGLSSPNYDITYKAGTLTITPAPLTVRADPSTKVYGQPLPSFTATFEGLVNGDTQATVGGGLSFTTPATAASPVGSYPVVPGGLSAANYTVTYVAGTLAVTPAPVTISADAKSREFGAANPVLTATFTGLVNGDTPASFSGTLALATTATAASRVGVYPISVGGVRNSNYTITFVPGTLTIVPATVTLTVTLDLIGNNNVVRIGATASPMSLAGSALTGNLTLLLDGAQIGKVQALNPKRDADWTVRIPRTSTNHVATVVFQSTNPNFAGAVATVTFTVPADPAGPGHRGGNA